MTSWSLFCELEHLDLAETKDYNDSAVVDIHS